MWLTQGNLNVKVTRATEDEIEWLRSKESGLTFTDRKPLFTTGKVALKYFFDLTESVFPAGFLPGVVKRAAEAKIQVQVIDSRTPPAQAVIPLPVSEAAQRLRGEHYELRDYQQAAVDAALKETRGIIQIATGGGKTNVAVAIVQCFPHVRWLFLVHRASLMAQAADRYDALTRKTAGRIGEGKWDEEAHFTCATFQSLAAALKKGKHKGLFNGVQGLIVDEAHTLPAESYNRVANALVNAYWRLGISATPLDREDQRSIYAVGTLGPVIFKHSADALITSGHLARPIIRLVHVEQEFDERDKYGLICRWNWKKVYDEGVIKSKVRNRALLSAVQKAEKPCLVFVKEIAHGKGFTKALLARGFKAEFVWGSANLHTRQAAVRRLVRGDTEVLVSSVIFQEGVDIPELRSVVVASGGKSVIAALQRIGRGMRLSAGKDTFEVYDVADSGNPWLERHAKLRKRAYQREKFAVTEITLTPSMPNAGQLSLGYTPSTDESQPSSRTPR
jgi:superfamily II DNA or RNA helicase